MSKYICIHGHFYQPPRENAWLEQVERQDSAYPYHDWNQRITGECYAQNASARILSGNKIRNIISNYAHISFNFGPTLLLWMEQNDPEIYQAILSSDKSSQEHFSGHGAALAQCYNHMIMPLANERDQRTQVIWGIKDFLYRFGRYPEGMWLPETAADTATLEALADQGIKFTILSPRQAKAVRVIGKDEWTTLGDSEINTREPYLCHLPSGNTIHIFFYDGWVSKAVAFEGLLNNGEYFAAQLMKGFEDGGENNQLVNVATDGETYGHHHKKGDMALAYCLKCLHEKKMATLTIYAEYLEKFPPRREVKIHENSSWSCIHGVERWRSDCGCCSGYQGHWNQKWRAPLRGALEWLRDNLAQIYEEQMKPFVNDPWQTRDAYIDVVLNRSPKTIEEFCVRHLKEGVPVESVRQTMLKSLEMQRHAMFMFTSCGWFFDEVSGIETVQVLQYAARAIQLAEELSSIALEKTFLHLLERVPSNIPEYGNASAVYMKFVKPGVLDLKRVGAHYAISSLIKNYTRETDIYCYKVSHKQFKRLRLGGQQIVYGRVIISSKITSESEDLYFAFLHLGDHNIIGGIKTVTDPRLVDELQVLLTDYFERSDIATTIELIKSHFRDHSYSIWHLFKDEQKKLLDYVYKGSIEQIESSLRHITDKHYPIIQVSRRLGLPIPMLLAETGRITLNYDLTKRLKASLIDCSRIAELIRHAHAWQLSIDRTTIAFLVHNRIDELMVDFAVNPESPKMLLVLRDLIESVAPLNLELAPRKAQNILFFTRPELIGQKQEAARRGDPEAEKWIKAYIAVCEYLHVERFSHADSPVHIQDTIQS